MMGDPPSNAMPPSLATAVVSTAIGLRALLFAWSCVQDRLLAVRFTDVDYYVFSDASRFVTQGQSPFRRPTYRYSPLIAFLLTPNVYLWQDFGKVLFAACDLIAGWLIYDIVMLQDAAKYDGAAQSRRRTSAGGFSKHQRALLAACFWLFNPLVASVSVRGNAESVLSCLVLATLWALLRGRLVASAALFGVAVHMKLYPVMYALPAMLYLAGPQQYSGAAWTRTIQRLFPPNCKQLAFALVSFAVFAATTGTFYFMYGREYIDEAFLYHLVRRDTKHNFSVYFYVLYLVERTPYASLVGALAFLPQAVLVVAAGGLLYHDPPLSWFVQTVLFVTFNKVCTSQYFLWYLTLLPLIVPHLQMSVWRGGVLAGMWAAAQGLWLGAAYLLEFQGYNTFLAIWMASIVFLMTCVVILCDTLKHYQRRDTQCYSKSD